MSMVVTNIAIVCGFCGQVVEVEEVPERVRGIDVIGIVRHDCSALNSDHPNREET